MMTFVSTIVSTFTEILRLSKEYQKQIQDEK